MPNTGPPFYAKDSAEAARAQAHMVSAKRRAAFRLALNAKLQGSPARLRQLQINFKPLEK